MAENDKEQIKKELSLILQLNKKLNYDNEEELKMTYSALMKKGVFKTTLGQGFLRRLEQIINGTNSSHQCVLCGSDLDNPSVVCTSCLTKYQKNPVQQQGTGTRNPQKNVNPQQYNNVNSQQYNNVNPQQQNAGSQQQFSDLSRQAATAMKGGLDKFTSKINEMAGESGAVDLKLRDLFSNVFKKHTREEGEEIFIAGTSQTTPDESQIAVSWPKPWLFSRVLLVLLASFALLYVCADQLNNENAIPGLIFLGALTVPFSVLIFIFETNAPRNISIFETVQMFFYGGAASLVLTLVLFEIFPIGELDYVGAVIVGFVEELGKILVAAVFIKKLNSKYILNGLLIGAAIGAGFAVFESAGYIFKYGIFRYMFGGNIDAFMDVLILRAWSSIGAHVAWTAITGAGLVMAKGEDPLTFSNFKNPKFLTFFIIPVILHAVWDCPFQCEIAGINIKILALIAIVWIIILVLINAGLKQIERLLHS